MGKRRSFHPYTSRSECEEQNLNCAWKHLTKTQKNYKEEQKFMISFSRYETPVAGMESSLLYCRRIPQDRKCSISCLGSFYVINKKPPALSSGVTESLHSHHRDNVLATT